METSVFADLAADRIDLVPGTKGSGKSALYRILVDFLAPTLLQHGKVVVAHGVQRHGDNVFLAFKDDFDALYEAEFVDFWSIYLDALAREQFVKNPSTSPISGTVETRSRALGRRATPREFRRSKRLSDCAMSSLGS